MGHQPGAVTASLVTHTRIEVVHAGLTPAPQGPAASGLMVVRADRSEKSTTTWN